MMSPVHLFMQADIIVKCVMLGLIAASMWTWTIIVGHYRHARTLMAAQTAFERDFANSPDLAAFQARHIQTDLPIARVLNAGLAEWRRSVAAKNVDKDGTRARLATTLASTITREVEQLGERVNILATIGSVTPFVGLFGTVWGIMRSFTAIAGQQSASLNVVAPGIAEALFATALGLFAAIPAVIAYNRITHNINRIESALHHFADDLHINLSRELERE